MCEIDSRRYGTLVVSVSTEQVTVALSDTDQEADEPIVTAVDGTLK